MRSLFFLLVLANVALLMWEYQKITRTAAVETSKSQWHDHGQSIVLRQELNLPRFAGDGDQSVDRVPLSQQKPILASPDAEVAGSAFETRKRFCYEVGPLVDSRKIGQWQPVLARLGAEITQFEREERVVKDYLVFYPAADTPEQSQINLEKLKTAGYRDAWLLQNEGRPGDISLGVFNQEAAALAMKEQLSGKGFMVEVKPREKVRNQVYALISGSSQIQAKVETLVADDAMIKTMQTAYCRDSAAR